MKRKFHSLLYSNKHGNIIVSHDNTEADCPIPGCLWVQQADRDLLSKLITHINAVHHLTYSSGPIKSPEDTKIN